MILAGGRLACKCKHGISVSSNTEREWEQDGGDEDEGDEDEGDEEGGDEDGGEVREGWRRRNFDPRLHFAFLSV